MVVYFFLTLSSSTVGTKYLLTANSSSLSLGHEETILALGVRSKIKLAYRLV